MASHLQSRNRPETVLNSVISAPGLLQFNNFLLLCLHVLGSKFQNICASFFQDPGRADTETMILLKQTKLNQRNYCYSY